MSAPSSTAPRRRLSILLTEGSSLSARQTLYALGPAGHVIDVCDPKPLTCLARYSRYVRACYRCPSFGLDPAGYLAFLKELVRRTRYDALFPTHDQVYLLARCRDSLSKMVGLPVPEFPAVQRLQSKANFVRLLEELNLPQPPTAIVRTRAELEEKSTFPSYIKLAYSTAGCGVWYVPDEKTLQMLADELEASDFLTGASELLVQKPAPGNLSVAQSVFQEGRIVAAHCYMARALGVGGSARARVSVSHPIVFEHLARLGAHLRWHGALMLDYLWDEVRGRPQYIEANPRIGETFNATLSGVNLCELLLQIALDFPVPSMQTGRVGVRTHSLLMTLLAAAQQGDRRRALLKELALAALGRGIYAESEDETTRPRNDPPSLLPGFYLTLRLLLNPHYAAATIRNTVDNYALSAKAVDRISQLPSSADP